MDRSFRLFDFNVFSEKDEEAGSGGEEEDAEARQIRDTNQFLIQMFGKNERGQSCSIVVEGFCPFFYVKVGDSWNISTKLSFVTFVKTKLGKFYEGCLCDSKLIKRKKLYGFDGGKEHKFVLLKFTSMPAFNKAKNIWYDQNRQLLPDGLTVLGEKTYLYEANIPPLLRLFHLKDISPSGWVALPNKWTSQSKHRRTSCDFDFHIHYKHIIALNDKETRVPLKICSFDIEASSSHGDFPVPIKYYKKLATNIIEFFEERVWTDSSIAHNLDMYRFLLESIIRCAFGFPYDDDDFQLNQKIELVYPKKKPKTLDALIAKWLQTPCDRLKPTEYTAIDTFFDQTNNDDDDGLDKPTPEYPSQNKRKGGKSYTVVDILADKQLDRNTKLTEVFDTLNGTFPALEGDRVTFIGSTFLMSGEKEPYLNHCAVLNTCSTMDGIVTESYATEKEVLLAWRDVILREDPDIIIGYNIFGFDYEFLFRRAQENHCVEDFLKMSRNRGELCAAKDFTTGRLDIESTSIQLASGQHDLKYIKMNGRVQIDLYNFFRREENLSSYKLDYVAGHFIGDYVKSMSVSEEYSSISTTNMTGLNVGSYIHFEEIGHSIDYYNGGEKFLVTRINKTDNSFQIRSLKPISLDAAKKTRWCLAKDDVTPKDIFALTNGTAEDRGKIAKYCIQDCNLVHYLMTKADILTGYVEMAKICSVPISFLVLRGQGIKLTSYVAKKCREKGVLMPVVAKSTDEDGYEGAIVLDPKCDLYMDNPVACVDYASLYPSSMMSENISHDSKVWTREYDLAGDMIAETGIKDPQGAFIYDNLPGYQYVNITYDTFKYVRKTPSAAAEKVRCGHKICRFAQPFQGNRAIMPSILEELLLARKTTRKLIATEADDFMKNVLDKRQLGYKVTANSLYGQCGAKTSSFYDKDCAASTTATGRLLLTYAKQIVEQCYGGGVLCDTNNHGPVKTNAEYIYGDTDSVFFTFNLTTVDGEPIRGKKALEITIELAQEAGHLASKFLKGPHDLEYEKTFMPFCLLSKKRYVGMLYETDPNKCKRKEMGIVLKRRDNAPIVKDIYGGVIDILMKHQDIGEAVRFLQIALRNIVDEKNPMDKLIISKSLRSFYKNPQQIAHKVLADRIALRDPGNKPCSGDRIPYVFIANASKTAKQGERIETPAFVREKRLKIDYSFYITNQIMKPLQQLFALVLERVWEMQTNPSMKRTRFQREVASARSKTSPLKIEDKIQELREKEIKALLFDEFLRETNNSKENNQAMTVFFQRVPK